jgi:hypothetical protein
LQVRELNSKADVAPSTISLTETALFIKDLSVGGNAFQAAKESTDRGHALELTVRQMLDLGGQLLLHGANWATVDWVSAEVSRLVDRIARTATDLIPTALNAHKEQLALLLARHFDDGNSNSLQHQLAEVLAEFTSELRAQFVKGLQDEAGPFALLRAELVGKLSAVDVRQDELLRHVTGLSERLATIKAVKDEREKGTAKGVDYESVVGQVIEGIFAPFQDTVFPVGTEAGAQGSRAGDFVVLLNPDDAEGHEVRIAIEAKCQRLSVRAALRELDEAMSNREACSGIMVFSDAAQAPIGGRVLRAYSGNRIIVVFGEGDANTLALEVACSLARSLALATPKTIPSEVDAQCVREQVDHLVELLEEAKSIARGASAARRGLDQIEGGYKKLRTDALSILSNITQMLRSAA